MTFVHTEIVRFRDCDPMGHVNKLSASPAPGTKSFELAYELHAAGRLVAEAKSVLVGYDYDEARSTEIPEQWRRRLSA